jgi:hypothetical protein
MKKAIHSLAIVLFVLVIILCLLTSYRHLDIQSTITLIIFNLFFVSLFFQLNGSPILKMSTLAAGNILGLFWNLVFHYISATGSSYFGLAFNVFFAIICPILNLMWIVPFWSLSLSFLPKLSPHRS